MDQPQERTELIGQFEFILGIATGGDRDAPFRTADEVESLVIDATRKLGNSTMRQRAQGGAGAGHRGLQKGAPQGAA